MSALQRRACSKDEKMKQVSPVQRCFWPRLEPVNDCGVDGGQEALTTNPEVGTNGTGCEDHVQVVAHLQSVSKHIRPGRKLLVCPSSEQ